MKPQLNRSAASFVGVSTKLVNNRSRRVRCSTPPTILCSTNERAANKPAFRFRSMVPGRQWPQIPRACILFFGIFVNESMRRQLIVLVRHWQ